jgi:hypothetical protein
MHKQLGNVLDGTREAKIRFYNNNNNDNNNKNKNAQTAQRHYTNTFYQLW